MVSTDSTLTRAEDRQPFLVEVNPDGTDIGPEQRRMPQRLRLPPNLTEVGSDPAIQRGQSLLLPFIHPRHCVINHSEGMITVTPSHRDAETFVNNRRIFQTTIIQSGWVIRLGQHHGFKLIDPSFEERLRHQASSATLPDVYANYAHHGPPVVNQMPLMQPPQQIGFEHILPAVLEFREETEEVFFNDVISGLDITKVHFKLAPTYTLYLATRFRASTHYRPELIPEERAVRLTDMLNYVADQMYGVIEANQREAEPLAFWMANASELLHFLQSDRHITSFSHQAQDLLAEAVHLAFKYLVVCLQSELEMSLPALFYDGDDDLHLSVEQPSPVTHGTLQVLQSSMILLRRCRVNAALTIQLFSQLFHFINMWTFNQIISSDDVANQHLRPGDKPVNFCSHKWGLRLKKRLSRVETWAEKQGLELAADCHLARIVQAAHLLLSRKNTAEDIASVSSICFKLNSLQLKTLLNKYEYAPEEKPISHEMIETIVRVAENTVDEVTNAEGREVRLEEDLVLQLPFLLPEDGYSCEIVRGVPRGLVEFLSPLQQKGLCIMSPQPTSSGFWTIYMDNFMPSAATPVPRSQSVMSQMGSRPEPDNKQIMTSRGEPEIQKIRLVKSNQGMGLSIVAAKGVGKDQLGIYIKAVVEGGAAWHDGRLQAGDQLLQVDGRNLVGISQEQAAEVMMQTGQVVELQVAKQSAYFHGLATLLLQPSPVMSRANSAAPLPPLPSSRQVSESGDYGPVVQSSRSFQNLSEQQQAIQNRPLPARGAPMIHQQPSVSPPHRAARSASTQNLSPVAPGHARLSQQEPLSNGRASGYPAKTSVSDDQGFYQNIGSSAGQHLQQHMPLRYAGPPEKPPTSRLGGSHSSLLQTSPRGRFEDPRIVGTPLSSSSAGSAARPSHQSTPTMSPYGPDKLPHFANESGRNLGPDTGARVRFQDNIELQPKLRVPSVTQQHRLSSSSVTDSVSSQVEQLRLSSVEREFRRRVAEYQRQNGDDAGQRPNKNVRFATESVEPSATPIFDLNDVPPPSQRLDMLVAKKLDASPTKKVLFVDENEERRLENDAYDDARDESLSRLEQVEKDPNVFIREAESLLNSTAMKTFDDTLHSKTSGRTPSVIGTQEVYNDPRWKRMQKAAEDEKATTDKRDGAKLSFKEKMLLFAAEAGESTPKEKPKISRAQRNIEGDEDAAGVQEK